MKTNLLLRPVRVPKGEFNGETSLIERWIHKGLLILGTRCEHSGWNKQRLEFWVLNTELSVFVSLSASLINYLSFIVQFFNAVSTRKVVAMVIMETAITVNVDMAWYTNRGAKIFQTMRWRRSNVAATILDPNW